MPDASFGNQLWLKKALADELAGFDRLLLALAKR